MANLICTYNVTDISSSTKICFNTDSFTDILYEGTSIGNQQNYQFTAVGNHTLNYVLKDNIIGDNAFKDCSDLKTIVIPEGVTSIGVSAFEGCIVLKEVSIGSDVTTIGDSAFSGCRLLTEITSYATEAPVIGENTFNGVSHSGTLYYPKGSDYSQWLITDAYYLGYYGWDGEVKKQTITGKLGLWVSSGTTTFKILENLSNVNRVIINGSSYLPNQTVSIQCCHSPHYVELNYEIELKDETMISSDMFRGGKNYKTLVLPDTITYIGEYAFSSLDITTITIPKNVTRIGTCAFSNSSINRIYALPTIAPTIHSSTFYNDKAHSGILFYPEGSDYSQWLSTDAKYLGYYNWRDGNIIEPINPDSIRLTCKYNVNTPYAIINLTNNIDLFSHLLYNGVSIGVTSTYQFETEGEHTLEFILKDNIIGDNAFKNCDRLASIDIPEGVTSIGVSAFYECRDLTSIVIPDGVTSIGDNAFEGCYYLTSIDIPDSVTSIGDSAFYECRDLTSIVIPDSVTSIGDNAFEGCESLTSIDIPDSVTSIGNRVFYGCDSLTSIDIPSSVTRIGDYAFYDCYGLTSIVIPEGVTSIGNNTFSKCSNLTSIVIPDSLTSIGDFAFSSCYDLTSVTFGSGLKTIGRYAFSSCESLTSIVIPEGVTSISDSLFSGCESLTSIVIPNSVTSIGGYAFYECKDLTSIDIPEGVTSIGDYAFYDCYNLESIFSKAIVAPKVSQNTFNDIGTYGTLYYPDGSNYTQWLSKNTYYLGYYNWNGVVIKPIKPDSIKLTCKYYVNDHLKKTTICGDASLFYDILYNGVPVGLNTTYSLDEGEHTLEFILNDNTIGDSAFEGCNRLTSIDIPEGVTSIGYRAFIGCGLLTDINISEGLTNIGDYAFYGCYELTNIVFPNSIQTIGNRVFDSCHSLTSVTLGKGLTNIGDYAFYECSLLKNITSKAIVAPTVTKYTFSWIAHNGTLYYPKGSDYSQWLSTEGTDYLGYKGWNGVEIEPEPIPDGEIVTPNQTMTIVTSGKTFQYTIETNNIEYIQTYYISFNGNRYLDSIDGFISMVMVNMNNFNITVEENEGDERRCSIYFQYMDYNGNQLTHVLTIRQDAKPEEEPEPVVSPFVNDVDVEWDGRVDDEIGIKIRVGYSNATPEEPMISDSWIGLDSVTEVQNAAAYGFDRVLEYQFFFDMNETLDTRFGSVDFSADGVMEHVYFTQSYNPYVEPDEPTYIEPEIRLYKTRLDYASDGGDKTVQIDYYGATSILEPTCTQSWVTIKKTGSGRFEEDGVRVDQHQYKITMQPTNFARNINVTFSCTDVNGKVFKDSHLMLYQSAPVATPTIVVSKNNISLDNVGDTSVIQVTYINVDEIVPPEVGDGFTIEEIERVESENGIQVKYKVTRISPKRQNAQINFKGNNTISGESATSGNVTIKGEPVPAEVEVTTIWPKKDDYFLIEEHQDCHIDFRVTNFNTPYTMTYSINDSNNAIYLRKSEESTLDNELCLSYDFKSLPNNTNNPFTGTIDFTYKDELTDYSVSIPFYVKYKNQGEVTVHTDFINFDKDGNRLGMYPNDMYVNVNYIRINELQNPEIDGDWIHVGTPTLVGDYKGWVEGEYVVVGETYKYDISIDTNGGASRSGSITFKGTGIDGREATFELEINQEGSDVVKPVDEGYIELQQLSVALNADGGAQTFQVKYYDAITIYEPELAGTWATITEVSRTEPVPDTAWNGEECESVIVTYKATAQPTDSGRQMKVKFKSDINYYNGGVVYMEKDKFIIYQLAEGSTEVQGDVAILRYSNTFTYYGSPTGWDFRVAYKNVTPDTPLISETWCRIKEVNELQADEYDYYKEYILEMDTNNSNFSRTCTITFIGNAEDGTQIKIPFQFTQQGQEEIVNEGEYANYKGYFMDFEGALHSVSFITNPMSETYGDIRLAGDSPVVVSYSETDTLYEPIRTSTCTVKVVSSHYLMNLYTGKAQGTQVILRNEDRDTVEWCGFLQPNLYNQGFTECIEEIEFEASDCLSTLQYLKYEYFYNGNGQPMIVSFKDIVNSIAEKCKLINSYVFSQRLFSNSDESKIFDFKEFYISENNFYSEEGEPWTYQEVLEELCKYFGYVCFQWGDKIYFMDYDKYQSNKTMVGYKYSKDDRWYNRSYITISNPNRITEESYRGTGADISLDDVFNKVTVNCNYYNLEHLLPDLFEDDLLTERNALSITGLVNRGQEVGHKAEYIVYDHKNIKSHFYKPIVGESIHEIEAEPTEDDYKKKSFFKDFVGGNIVDMYYLNYSDLKGKTFESKEWEKYLMISQLNRPWCTGPIVGEYDTTKYWENYNFPIMEFTQIPHIFIDNHKEVYESNTTTGGRVPSTRAGFGTSSSTPNSRPSINSNKSEHYFLIRAEAAFTPHFSEAYVPENVDETGFGKWSNSEYVGHYFDRIANTTKKEQNFAPKLTFYLEIPTAGWWNGTKWVDYETWFEVPLEELHYSDELWYTWKNTQNKVQTNLFLGKSGYKIQLPEDMESTAFMQFKIGMPKRFAHVSGGDDNGEAGNAYCFIKNLEVDIVSRNTSLIKDEDIVYENVIDDNNVVDGPEIDLKITSDNNITYSFSTVSTKYGEDMINTTNFRFYDKEGEMILPEEAIIERYVNQYSTPTLKENVIVDMTFTPAQMITDTYWNKDFVIVGQEIDYQMCRQEITLLEKK